MLGSLGHQVGADGSSSCGIGGSRGISDSSSSSRHEFDKLPAKVEQSLALWYAQQELHGVLCCRDARCQAQLWQ